MYPGFNNPIFRPASTKLALCVYAVGSMCVPITSLIDLSGNPLTVNSAIIQSVDLKSLICLSMFVSSIIFLYYRAITMPAPNNSQYIFIINQIQLLINQARFSNQKDKRKIRQIRRTKTPPKQHNYMIQLHSTPNLQIRHKRRKYRQTSVSNKRMKLGLTLQVRSYIIQYKWKTCRDSN
jgi:hypothetical protein